MLIYRIIPERYANPLMIAAIACVPVWLAWVFVSPHYQIYRFDKGGEASRGIPPFYSSSEVRDRKKGRPVRAEALKPGLKRALYRRPTLESCLADQAGGEEEPRLRELSSEQEVMVRLFRLFALEETATSAAAWLKSNGLKVHTSGNNDPDIRVGGIWRPQQAGPHPLFPSSDDLFPPVHASINFYWTDKGETLETVEVGTCFK